MTRVKLMMGDGNRLLGGSIQQVHVQMEQHSALTLGLICTALSEDCNYYFCIYTCTGMLFKIH